MPRYTCPNPNCTRPADNAPQFMQIVLSEALVVVDEDDNTVDTIDNYHDHVWANPLVRCSYCETAVAPSNS